MYETLENTYYYYFYNNKHEISQSFFNTENENENEINKVIKEVENEIKMEKEIKDLEKRYTNLCEFMKEEYDDEENNNNNNKSNNDGAIKLSVKKDEFKKKKVKYDEKTT
jgi:signal transduction histidine kinase